MHIPDGFVSGPINAVCGVVAAASVGIGAYMASRSSERRERIVPLLGMTAAFVFAAQMINFPIGGGTSGHFLGAAFVAAMLGGWNACTALALVLVIQCFGFADGGITALGTNIVNMGVIGGFGAYAFMWLTRALLPVGKGWFLATAAAGAWLSIVSAATMCSLELAASGTSPLGIVIPAMVGTHAIIGISEALITVSVLSIVAGTRPDILPAWSKVSRESRTAASRWGLWGIAVIGFVVALALATFVSPFASSSPDGLEKVAEDKGFHALAEGSVVWKDSPLPDYRMPGVESAGVSTSLAGIIGTVLIFALGFGIIRLAVGRKNGRSQGKG
jgi:cobalt/nickel transport system permease protein